MTQPEKVNSKNLPEALAIVKRLQQGKMTREEAEKALFWFNYTLW